MKRSTRLPSRGTSARTLLLGQPVLTQLRTGRADSDCHALISHGASSLSNVTAFIPQFPNAKRHPKVESNGLPARLLRAGWHDAFESALPQRRRRKTLAQISHPRRLLQPIARRRLAAVRTVQFEPALKFGHPCFQGRIFSPQRRNQRDQFFFGQLAWRLANHPILKSKTSSVQRNLSPIQIAVAQPGQLHFFNLWQLRSARPGALFSVPGIQPHHAPVYSCSSGFAQTSHLSIVDQYAASALAGVRFRKFADLSITA